MSAKGRITDCALWYWRYHSLYYELFGSEDEAANAAVYMEDSGECSVAGVQFADGRAIERNDWAAYAEAVDRMLQAEREAEVKRQAEPPRPVRKIRPPFGRDMIEVDASAPAWLG